MIDQSSVKLEAALSAPPATIAAVTLAGVGLQDWVLIATLVWITLQVGWFCYQRGKEFCNKDKG